MGVTLGVLRGEGKETVEVKRVYINGGENSRIQLLFTSSEGRVEFAVKGRLLRYKVDAGLIPIIKEKARFTPGAALHLVKQKGEFIKKGGSE